MRCGENQAALGANEQLELWGPMPKLTYLWALLSRALDLAVCCPEQELTHRTSLSSPALIFLPRLLGQMSYLYWVMLPGNLDLGKIPSLFPGSCSVSPNLLTGCAAGSLCVCAHTCTCMSTPLPILAHGSCWPSFPLGLVLVFVCLDSVGFFARVSYGMWGMQGVPPCSWALSFPGGPRLPTACSQIGGGEAGKPAWASGR